MAWGLSYQTPVRMIDVTPSDTVNLATAGILYIGTAGDIKILTSGGDTQTITIATDGTFFPVVCARVFATDTTATNVKVCY